MAITISYLCGYGYFLYLLLILLVLLQLLWLCNDYFLCCSYCRCFHYYKAATLTTAITNMSAFVPTITIAIATAINASASTSTCTICYSTGRVLLLRQFAVPIATKNHCHFWRLLFLWLLLVLLLIVRSSPSPLFLLIWAIWKSSRSVPSALLLLDPNAHRHPVAVGGSSTPRCFEKRDRG